MFLEPTEHSPKSTNHFLCYHHTLNQSSDKSCCGCVPENDCSKKLINTCLCGHEVTPEMQKEMNDEWEKHKHEFLPEDWEKDFTDFWWEQGRHKGRKLGLSVYVDFISNLLAKQKEVCICAAVMTKERGAIRGHRHYNCLEIIYELNLTQGEQGFITSRNRFVSRIEGRRLQEAAGIKSVSPDGYQANSLYSEDLY